MGSQFLNPKYTFLFKFNFSQRYCYTRSALHAIRGFRRQFAAGALIWISNFSSLWNIILWLISQIKLQVKNCLIYLQYKQNHLCYIVWKGYCIPFCFSSKGSLPPFGKKPKGIRYRMQNRKKSAKIKMFCMRLSDTFLQLAKGTLISLRAVAKCGIRELHATQIIFCNIPHR